MPSCHTRLIAEAPLSFVPGSQRPVIRVEINDHSAQFLIDTAGSSSMVSPALAAALRLTVHAVPAEAQLTNQATGIKISSAVDVGSLSVSGAPLPVTDLLVLPDVFVRQGIDGVLSGDVLHHFITAMDFPGHQIRFYASGACMDAVFPGPSASLHFHGFSREGERPDWHVIVPASLDGNAVDVTLDTGAAESFFFWYDGNRAIPFGSSREQVGHLPQKYGFTPVYRYRAGPLDIGKLRLPDMWIVHLYRKRSRESHARSPRPQLTLGMNALRTMRLAINYDTGMLYLDTP